MIPIVTYLTLNGFVAYAYNFMGCSAWISGLGVISSRFDEVASCYRLTHEGKKRKKNEQTRTKTGIRSRSQIASSRVVTSLEWCSARTLIANRQGGESHKTKYKRLKTAIELITY